MIFIILLFGKCFFLICILHFTFTIFSQDAFSSPLLSIIQTFSMMLGDINYRDAFLEPFLRNELAYPVLSFIQIIAFTMFVPIVLMNLLVSNFSLHFLFVDHVGAFSNDHYSLPPLTPFMKGKRDYYKIYLYNIHLVPGCAGHSMRPRGYQPRCIHLADTYEESRQWSRCWEIVVNRPIPSPYIIS